MMSIQNPYSLLNRTYEVGLAEISIRDEIGLLAYSPLASGYLSGKYRNNQLPKNSRIERDPNFWTRYAKPNTEKAVDAYHEIANKYDLSARTPPIGGGCQIWLEKLATFPPHFFRSTSQLRRRRILVGWLRLPRRPRVGCKRRHRRGREQTWRSRGSTRAFCRS